MICVSKQSMSRYRHALGAPSRKSNKSTAEKRAAYAKGVLTRAKNDAYKKFLSDFQKQNLSYDALKNKMAAWKQANGMHTPQPTSTTDGSSSRRKSRSVKGSSQSEPEGEQADSTH